MKEPSKKLKGIATVDVLLTALIITLNEFTQHTSQLIDLRKHGRDSIPGLDLVKTIGWFTIVHPIHLRLDRETPLLESRTFITTYASEQ